jgi:hypothetical protein
VSVARERGANARAAIIAATEATVAATVVGRAATGDKKVYS